MSYYLSDKNRELLPLYIEKSKDAVQIINDELSKIMNQSGLYFHCFSRMKAAPSLITKITKDPNKYTIKEFEPELDNHQEPRITDLIGSRIVLYYKQDVEICYKILSDMFEIDMDNTKIDDLGTETFHAARTNLIFTMTPDMLAKIEPELFMDYPIAPKFEVQIRTTFSEGWHEVEHDMVYKHHEEWDQSAYKGSKRRLNSLYATLEGCDSMMEMIFDERATFCYNNQDICGLLRYKFRIRFADTHMAPELIDFFKDSRNGRLLKDIYEYDRSKVLLCLTSKELEYFDKNITNLLYVIVSLMSYEKLLGMPLKGMKNPVNKSFQKQFGMLPEFIKICDIVTRYLRHRDNGRETINFHYRQSLFNDKMLSFSNEHSSEFADFFAKMMRHLYPKYETVEAVNVYPVNYDEKTNSYNYTLGDIRKDGFNPVNGTYYYIYTSGDVLRKKTAASVWNILEANYHYVMEHFDRASEIKRFKFTVNTKSTEALPAPIPENVAALDASSPVVISTLGSYKLRKAFFDINRNAHRAMLGLLPVELKE